MKKKKRYQSVILSIVILIAVSISSTYAQDVNDPKKSFINCKLNISGIVNNSFSNLFINNLNYTQPSMKYNNYSYKYSKNNSTPLCFGLNFGAELELGKGKFIKQIIGLNYDLTNSNYNFNSSYLNNLPSNYFSEIKDIRIRKNAHFISLGYGILFQLPRKINLSALGCINLNIYNVERQNGNVLTSNNNVIYDTIILNNSRISNNLDTSFLSIRVKISKDFNLVSKKFGVFLQHNISLRVYHNNKYIAPWWMFGIQFNTFNKTKFLKNK